MIFPGKLTIVIPAAKATSFFFLLLFLFQIKFSFSQTTYPAKDWVKKLNKKDFYNSPALQEIYTALKGKDSAEVMQIFKELEQDGTSSGYFNTNLDLTKATWRRLTYGCKAKKSITDLVKKALNAAYEAEDDHLVSNIGWFYGAFMHGCLEMESAAIYCLIALEIDQKTGKKTEPDKYGLLGDVLYLTQDYEKAIEYTRKAIQEEPYTSAEMKHVIMSRWNTIGLCWRKMGGYDSSLFYFDVALQIAKEINNPIWQVIISGNKGQVYYLQKKYAIAKPLLEADYRESKAYGEVASAANSLQWVARINLLEGKKDSALLQVKEAMQLLHGSNPNFSPNPNYLQNILYATADVYRAFGNYDSVDKYTQLYNRLHDSLERALAVSRLEMSKMKLDNIQNALTIKNLHKVKQAEELKRNFFIAAIILLSVIALLYVNRLRLKSRHKEQLAVEQKKAADAEIVIAKEQLRSFTQNITEKTNLIEQLQQQVNDRALTTEQQELISNISSLTILTESDWEKFKTIFEKIYPGFFIHLKEKVSDITIAEQRMAALTRLHFSVNQIASMLGISANSVYKTKQRLRQRLHVGSDLDLEDILSSM